MRRSLDTAFMEPIQNLTAELIEPAFNLSAAEQDFFRLPTSEFHERINNQFEKVQKRVFNESLASIQNDLDRFNTSHLKEENRVRELHEKRPGYERKEETYKIPSKDGVRIVRKGLKKYKDHMENWVEQTFVHKPQTLVREEQSKLQNSTAQSEDRKVPLDKLEELWGFERDFHRLMRKYQKDMTSRVFDRYDRLFDHFLGHEDEFFKFPRSLYDLENFMWEGCGHSRACRNGTHTPAQTTKKV